MLEIWTDGSTRKNGTNNAVGAWGFAAYNEGGRLVFEACDILENATNQRAEMIAVLQACMYAFKEKKEAVIHTDSAYVYNCYAQKWYKNWQKNGWKNSKKEPVANQELWLGLIPYFEMDFIHFNKTKGHANDERNNYVDKMVQNRSLGGKA